MARVGLLLETLADKALMIALIILAGQNFLRIPIGEVYGYWWVKGLHAAIVLVHVATPHAVVTSPL